MAYNGEMYGLQVPTVLQKGDERVKVWESSCPQNGKPSLQTGEPQVGQQQEDIE